MKKIMPFLFIIVVAVLISGCSQYNSNREASASLPPQPPSARQSANAIEITVSGFSPSPLTVKAGETVTFVNKDAAQHWPASAMHPTHTVYPGSDINKCSTGEAEAATIFDACTGLAQDETFSFTFNEKGTWKYHDHLKPSLFGAVVVE